MRKLLYLIVVFLLLFSCKTDSKSSDKKESDLLETEMDSLPEGKWNGEYLQIEDKEEAKTHQKRGHSSNYYSMGKATVEIGETEYDFALFDKKRNVLTFTTSSINAIITNSSGDEIKLRFKKNEIVSNHKGKYRINQEAEQNGTARFSFKEINSEEELKLVSGEMEILDFNPRLATFEFKINGTFSAENGDKLDGNAYFKMNFEEAIMTPE